MRFVILVGSRSPVTALNLERSALNVEQLPMVHEYQRIARQGFAQPLTHRCGEEYTVRVKDDLVKLQCFACGTLTDPALADIKAMEAKIADYKAKRA